MMEFVSFVEMLAPLTLYLGSTRSPSPFPFQSVPSLVWVAAGAVPHTHDTCHV